MAASPLIPAFLVFTTLVPVVPAGASMMFYTPPGATTSAGPVSATAEFSFSGNTLTISVANSLLDPRSIGQNISDLTFSVLLGGVMVGGGSLVSSSAIERTIYNNAPGGYSDGPVVSTGWGLDSTAPYHLNVLGFAGPTHTIVGNPDSSNAYASANASITNQPHNSHLAGTVQFVLIFPDLPAGASISGVVFSFGTRPGSLVAACLLGQCENDSGGSQEASELPSIFLLFAGLAILAWIRFERSRKSSG
jgi:hypothetical protein